MKKIIALLLVLALALSLAACSGSAGSSSTNPATVTGNTGPAEDSAEAEGTNPADSEEDEGGVNPATVTGNTGPEGNTETELVLYTWEAMFPQEVLDAFEADTGIKVNYVNFDYDETMLARLEEEEGGAYDVVIADDYIIETAVKEGLVAELDKEKLPSFGNIDPFYQGWFYDPDDLYTVPYGAGVQTIVYDPALTDVEIDGYEDLWDESLRDSIGITANYRVIDGMALKVLGESMNTSDVAKIEEAGEKLNALAPNIRLIKDDRLEEDLLSGEISAGIMYTSQVTSAMMQNPDLKVVYPKEGIGFGIMGMFIPSAAPHANAAYKFLEYILQPEVAAQCFEYIGYYSTNKAANEFISDEYKGFLTLPEDIDLENAEILENISNDALDAHNLVWETFRAATGAGE